MASNITQLPHQSRRIRWWSVALLVCGLVSIPIFIWIAGIASRQPIPQLVTVGGNPSVGEDVVKKQVIAVKKEPPKEKPKEESVDKRWEEAEFHQQLELFNRGWQEYFQLRQSEFDRTMQRKTTSFQHEMKTAEVLYEEAGMALRSQSDGSIYNNTEKNTGNMTTASTPNTAIQDVLQLHREAQASGQLTQSSPLATNYLTEPKSSYVLYAGTHLPITLDQWMNSDANGGSWVGHVNADVYDSLTGKDLLIPAGARVFGVGAPTSDNNEQPVLSLKMTMLMFPPNRDYPHGAYLAAPGIDAQTQLGIQGLSGDVNHHFVARYGAAAVLSLVTAGVRMATYSRGGGFFAYTPEDAAVNGAGSVMGQVVGEELRRTLKIRPTISVPIGYNFVVTLQQVQELPRPYRR